jgi:hypothetical protein
VDEDLVTTVLELSAVVLLAVGVALAVAALLGGLLGAGAGLAAAALVLGAAAVVLRWLTRPARPVRRGSR